MPYYRDDVQFQEVFSHIKENWLLFAAAKADPGRMKPYSTG